jgi:hypothetical protein
VGTDAIRLIDPNTNALVASASRAHVTATTANYELVSDVESQKVPVLIVGVPGFQPLTIRCPHRGWSGKVPRERSEPEFRVSDEDSRTLVEYFGLSVDLND